MTWRKRNALVPRICHWTTRRWRRLGAVVIRAAGHFRARQNQALSGLADRPVRWIVEDALKYLRREERRGVRYDGIIMDPPAFGRGPGGEVWSFEQLYGELCAACRSVLSQQPRLVVATLYTRSADFTAILETMRAMMAGHRGDLTAGRMVTLDRSAGREIEHGQFVRWVDRVAS